MSQILLKLPFYTSNWMSVIRAHFILFLWNPDIQKNLTHHLF